MTINRICIVSILAAVVAGCGQTQQATNDLTGIQPAANSSTEPARDPKSLKQSYREMLTRQAMRGLRYDFQRVTIDRRQAAEVTRGWSADQAAAEYLRGAELLEVNSIIESIAAHTRAVLLAPDQAELYYGLGMALKAKRKLPQAEAAFQTALDLDENHIDARFQLANTLTALGSLAAGIEQLQQVLSRDPDHTAAHSRLAISYYYNDQQEEARQHVERAKALGYRVPPQFEAILAGENFSRAIPAGAAAGGNAPVIGAQVRIDLTNPDSANETSAAALNTNPPEIVGTWNDYRTNDIRSGASLSMDGGQTWQDFVFRPPAQYQSSVEGDPMTCYDNRTGHLWIGAISFGGNGGIYVARKNAGDTQFQPSVMARPFGGTDKGWMAAGVNPNSPDDTILYITYNEGLIISTDLGDSWTTPRSLGSGIGFLPRIGPNGELYITYWDFGAGVKMIRSFDGGNTLSAPITIAVRMDVWGTQSGSRFPGSFRVPSLNYLAVDPNDGTLYCVYFDTTDIVGGNRNVDLYFCKSSDQGTTWTTPVVINGDNNPPGDQFFPWLEVDRFGRIHLLFYDTRAIAQNDNQNAAFIEAYYSYSDDGGDTWIENVLTDQPFDSTQDTTYGGGFIGDYLGMGIAGDYVYPCYLSTHEGTSNIYVHSIFNNIESRICADGGTLVEGSGQQNDFSATCGSDDIRWAAHGETLVFQITDPVTQFELSATADTGTPNSISVNIEARKQSDDANLNVRALLFDFDAGQYVALPGVIPLGTADAVQAFELPAGSSPENFVEPGTQRVRLLIQTIQTSGLSNVRTELDEVLFITN